MNRITYAILAGAFFTCLSSPTFAAVTDHLPGLQSDDLDVQDKARTALFSEAANAARPGAEGERVAYSQALCKALAEGQSPVNSLVLINLLVRVGDAEAVPELTRLLGHEDAHVREGARMALSANLSDEAGEALVAALGNSPDAQTLTGLYDALAVRGHPKAVKILGAALQNPETARVAAASLARIPSPAAARALVQANQAGDAPYLTEALIELTAGARRQGNDRLATTVYRHMLSGEQPEAVRRAALIGYLTLADARPAIAKNSLQDPSEILQAAVVEAAFQAESPRIRQRVARHLPEASPELQLRILSMLEQTATSGTEEWIVPLLKSDQDVLASAAAAAMAKVGTERSIPALMEVSAVAALSQIPSDKADAIISRLAAEGDADSRAMAIEVLANRQGPDATRALLRFASESDDTIAAAGLKALKDVASAGAMPALTDLLLESGSSARGRLAMDAAVATLRRSPDQEATVAVLAKALSNAEGSAQSMIYKVLAQAGSDAALTPIVFGTRAATPELRDPALRALADWREANAIDPLLALAENADLSLKEHALVVRGLARLLGSAGSAELAASESALRAARRPDERKMILGAIGQSDSKAALGLLEPYLDDPEVGAEATAAAAAIQGRMKQR